MTLGDGLTSLIPPRQDSGEVLKKNDQESRQRRGLPRAAEISRGARKQSTKQSTDEAQDKQAVFQIETSKIKPNPYQPRRIYNNEGLRGLAQSIREVGIIHPLVASKIETETDAGTQVTYQLISGERRLRAAELIGMERVPVIVQTVNNDRDKLSVALIENIQRENLNPIEAAKAYARLQDEFALTQREIAAKVGKSRESIANTLRLLNLPSRMQKAVAQNEINESQARALLTIRDAAEQERAFNRLMHKKMSTKKHSEQLILQRFNF